MRTLVSVLSVCCLGVLAVSHGAWGGGMSDPKSGDYWWFDQAQPTWPHPGYPTPVPLHPGWQELTTQSGVQKYKADDIPLAWQLKDSIWYYGAWYRPTANYLYISPDGWISFTSGTTPSPVPHASFPDAALPNAVFAPFWADWYPLGGAGSPEPNAVYYFYNTTSKTLGIEWYRVTESGKTTQFTFEAFIQFGGKARFYNALNFSYHFIDFLYHSSFPAYNPATWPADYLVGIEDQAGAKGLTVSSDQTTYQPGPGTRLRFYYRKVYRYDVMAWDIMSPGRTVLRYTKIEPRIVVANVGQEMADLSVTFRIDSGSKNVYSQTRSVTGLYPPASCGPISDTIVLPCWDRPADVGATYKMKLTTSYSFDQNPANDTCSQTTEVGCDDVLAWPWDYRVDGWGLNPGYSAYRFATGYGMSGGAMLTGARAEFYPGSPLPGTWQLEVWRAQTGCGLPLNAANGNVAVSDDQPGNQSGWTSWVEFSPPAWASSSSPGNIWVAWRPTDNANPSGYLSNFSFYADPGLNNCFNTSKPTPWTVSAVSTNNGASWSWGADQNLSGEADAWALEAQTHLGLAVPPAPPCYSGVSRDIVMLNYQQPDDDGYIEALVPIAPTSKITNWGRQTEPGTGTFHVLFQADSAGTRVYDDSTAVSKIGWLGNPTDNPDTLTVSTPNWTPAGGGHWDGSKHVETTYDTRFVVKLGAIGPDKSDHCPYNDTLYKDITPLWKHDVGVFKISQPDPDYSVQGAPVPIVGHFLNFGITHENSVPVETKVFDRNNVLVYANSGTVEELLWRADPYHDYNDSCIFAPWNSTAGKAFGEFKLEVWSRLVGDQDATDDVMSMSYYIVYNKNLAALDITSGMPKQGIPYIAKGLFENRGASAETDFTVTFKVLYGGGEIFTSSKTVARLDPVQTVEVEFDPWTPSSMSGHSVTLHIETPGGDDNPADDVFEREFPGGVDEPAPARIPTAAYLAAVRAGTAAGGPVIEYGLPKPVTVELTVYDALGQLVATLESGVQPAGVHKVAWSRRDRQGRVVSPGVYVVRLRAGDFQAQRKFVLLK